MADQQEYQVTARKWRPVEFLSVVGQEHVTQTLKNAIRSNRLHHAYLFSGPRGVGKTTTARILAKALNCQNPGPDLEPCNVCDSCRQITEGRSLDVVEIDGASNNSVEDIRKLRDNAKYPPMAGRYKLYIIDEVHMLSTSAFNALLKTLEEPPKHLVFIFATTEPHKVPATILSRCQRFDFRRMQISDIVGRLAYIAEQEGMQVEEDALVVIAKKGDGSMRDSQSIFDQVVSFCGTTVTYNQANDALNIIDQGFFFRVTDMMRQQNTAESFAIVEHIMQIGYDPQEFLIGLAEHLRNYLTVITTGSTRLIETAKVYRDRYGEEARGMEQGDIIRALHLTLAAQQAVRTASQPRLRLELAMVQLAVMDSTVNLTQLLEKIDGMPEGTGGSSPRPVAAAAPPIGTPAPAPSVPPAGATPEAPATAGAATGGYASMIREGLAGGKEGKGISNVKDLASFPTTAPVVARQAIYTADPDVATLSRPANGASSILNGNGNGNGSLAYTTDVLDTLVMENGGAPAAGGWVESGLSLREIQGRWSEFLRSCDDKMLLASALQGAQPAEIHGSAIRLFVPQETQVTLLNRNKQALNEKLSSFFNIPMQAEWTLGVPPVALPENDFPVNGNGAGPHADHPFIKGIMELLGATQM